MSTESTRENNGTRKMRRTSGTEKLMIFLYLLFGPIILRTIFSTGMSNFAWFLGIFVILSAIYGIEIKRHAMRIFNFAQNGVTYVKCAAQESAQKAQPSSADANEQS